MSAERGLQETLDRLKGKFVTAAPELAARLRELAARPSLDAEGITELRSIAHRLAGTAGLFGFAAIGETAGQLDATLDNALLDREPDRDTLLPLIETLAGHLDTASPSA
jgi:HPt (histidine-containing phosphotransfer) domain-containing protein